MSDSGPGITDNSIYTATRVCLGSVSDNSIDTAAQDSVVVILGSLITVLPQQLKFVCSDSVVADSSSGMSGMTPGSLITVLTHPKYSLPSC